MRTENSVKNSVAGTYNKVIQIILGLIMQTIFIRTLGVEYLGLNGLFTNIVAMLTVIDMGISDAIIFSLYRPLAENDKETIQALMVFYKKCYRIIGSIVFIVGLFVIPFLPIFVGTIDISIHVTFVYILYLFDAACSYWLVYKRSILYASQQNYIISNTQTICLIFLDITQIFVLIVTRNFYLYLVIKIFMRLVENFILSIISHRKYPFIQYKSNIPLPLDIKMDITKKVKGLIIHKVSKALVNGSDNIVISTLLGVKTVGLYYNYNMIITYVQQLFLPMITATTASIGNLLVIDESSYSYNVFKKIWFINFWIAAFTGTALLNLANPFITLWVGKKFLLSFSIIVVLIFNHYQQTMMYTFDCFKNASGIFYEDRHAAILEVVLNLGLSIFLAVKIGLMGVFIGTIVSSCVRHLYTYPKYVFVPLFQKKRIGYYIEFLKKFLMFLFIIVISTFITDKINLRNILLELLARGIAICVIPNLILWLIYRKSGEFEYFIELILKIIIKVKTKFRRSKNGSN